MDLLEAEAARVEAEEEAAEEDGGGVVRWVDMAEKYEYKKQEEKLKAGAEAERQWQAKVAANKRREAGRRKRIEIKWQAEMDKERVLLRR